jgi:hypothetical protein
MDLLGGADRRGADSRRLRDLRAHSLAVDVRTGSRSRRRRRSLGECCDHLGVHLEWVLLDVRPGIAVHEPVVTAEGAVVAAITTDLRRRVMVADAVKLHDQPLGERDVVAPDLMHEDVDRVGFRGVGALAVSRSVPATRRRLCGTASLRGLRRGRPRTAQTRLSAPDARRHGRPGVVGAGSPRDSNRWWSSSGRRVASVAGG